LAVFSGDIDLNGLNTYLRSLDKEPIRPLFDGQGSHRDIDLKISLTDTLKDLRDRFNCLLIFPHPDQPNGLCKSLTTEVAAKLLMEIRPDAIECFQEKEKKKLQSTGILSESFWDRLAFVAFSNPKRIEEIGNPDRVNEPPQATYLKLSATNLDALRLALHDPETRLSLHRTPLALHPRIRRMAISGTGFLGNLNISWNQDLNVIIGGRSVGKSAILETLRYAFAITPHSDPSYHEELVRHALGNSGKVEVDVDRPMEEGKIHQYRIVRAWGEEPHTFQLNPEKSLSVFPSKLLGPNGGPTIFGQREIYAVSGSEEHRLGFLDDLIGEEARKCADAVGKAMESLTSNAEGILDMQAKLARREEYSQRLKKIEHEIEIYKRNITEKLKEVADLRKLGACLQNAAKATKSALGDFDEWRLNLLASVDTARQNLRGPQGKQSAALQEGETVLSVLQESLRVVFDDERTLFEQAIQNLTRLDVRCQEKLRPLEQEVKQMEEEAKRIPLGQDRLQSLTEEKTSLTSLVKELSEIEDRLKTLRQKRKGLLQHVRDCRKIQNKLRNEKAAAIETPLNGRLHLHVEFKGQKGSYKEQLALLLRGSNLSQDAIDLFVAPKETDGIALAEAVRAGSKEVQTRFGLKPEMADRLIHWLTAEESRLFELETLIPQDAFQMELKIDGQYRALEHLSVGQSATAVLLLLFGLENRILIIDQPDDYLDDRFVHEEILQILREQKGLKDQNRRRQIIFTTNDATLPVMGDAELVIPLEAQDDHVYAINQASIDDRSIQEHIKTLMQGGEEAFQQRAEKYGGTVL
jgi:hypothetical protein